MSCSGEVSSGRSLRPRLRRDSTEQKPNVDIAPLEEDVIQEIYCQGNAQVSDFRPTSLETIYESPRSTTGSARDIMGVVKLRRQCRFSPFYNPPKCKLTKRKNKAKSLKRVGVKVPSGLTITAEQLDKVLREISDDENEENKLWISNSLSPWYQKDNIIAADTSSSEISNLTSDLAEMKMEFDCIDEDYKSFEHKNTKLTDNEFSYLNSPMQSREILEDQIDRSLCLTPTKITAVEKSKRNRRRSGRVQILSFNDDEDVTNISPAKKLKEFSASSPLVGVLKMNEFLNKEKDTFIDRNLSAQSPVLTGSKLLVCVDPNEPNHAYTNMSANSLGLTSNIITGPADDVCYSSLSIPTCTSSCSSTNSSINTNYRVPAIDSSFQREIPKALRKERKRPRRLSGIRGSFYSASHFEKEQNSFYDSVNLNVSLNVQTQQICDTEEKLLDEKFSEEKLLSPSSLLSQLNIYSPSSMPVKRETGMKNRRRSARLSIENEVHLGSIWKENEESDNNTLVNVPKPISVKARRKSKNISHDHETPEICTQENFLPYVETCVENPSNIGLDNLNTREVNSGLPVSVLSSSNGESSPVLSGIIDCRGKISKGKKYILKSSSSQFNLKSFTPFNP